ncbi:MAG TPA: hypothetical protein VJC11_00030 [Patescibacteria group bacterium]|nr:hypothetical protein [Patescibacteria group bacterium]
MINLGKIERGRLIFCPNCEITLCVEEKDIEWKHFNGIDVDEGGHFFVRCMICQTPIIIGAGAIPEDIQRKARKEESDPPSSPPLPESS